MKAQYDKQAEKFLITPVKKLKKNINVIDIIGHDVPYHTAVGGKLYLGGQ